MKWKQCLYIGCHITLNLGIVVCREDICVYIHVHVIVDENSFKNVQSGNCFPKHLPSQTYETLKYFARGPLDQPTYVRVSLLSCRTGGASGRTWPKRPFALHTGSGFRV